MRHMFRRFREDTSGATLAVTAVMIVSILSSVALVLDLGMLRLARGEAQRVADSSALAGASAFRDIFPATSAVQTAQDRAYDYAISHVVRNVSVDSSEVTISIDANLRRVHVLITRPDVPLWFARLFGWTSAPVSASAMAHATRANSSSCVSPLALPDWWGDPLDDTALANPNNRIPDSSEVFTWGDDSGEAYQIADPHNPQPGQTGLGSDFRNGQFNEWGESYNRDRGRLIAIKPLGSPSQNSIDLSPGFFHALDLSFSGYGPNGWKGAMVDAALGNCAWDPVGIGESINLDPQNGQGTGPTISAFDSIYNMDPTAYWDPVSGNVLSNDPAYAAPNSSPRVLDIFMFDPAWLDDIQGKQPFEANNIARFFIESVPKNPHQDVMGRFLFYATGFNSGGGPAGTLTLTLQLIK